MESIKSIIIAIAFLCAGCSHVSVEKSVQGTQSILVGVAIMTEIQTEKIQAAQEVAMRRCESAVEREECLGELSYDHAELLRQAGEVYDRIATDLEELRAFASTIDAKAAAAEERLKDEAEAIRDDGRRLLR